MSDELRVAEEKPEGGAESELSALEGQLREAVEKAERSDEAIQPAEKAADQPAEKVEKPAVETPKPEQAKQEDDEPIPDKPGKEWFIRERQKRRELKAEYDARVKELQDRLQSVEGRVSEAAQQKPTSTAPQVRASEVFRLYAKAKLGEFTGDAQKGMSAEEQNALVLRHAQSAIEREFSVDEIEEVLNDAAGGKLGPYSAEVAEAAKLALPIAMLRERKTQGESDKQRTVVEAMRRTAEQEIAKVVEKYPAFKDSNSEEYKHVAKWNAKWVGEIDPSGKITKPGLLSEDMARHVLTHPALHAELVLQDLASERYHTTAAENQRLKSQVEKTRQPESPSRPQAGGEPHPGSSEAILAELEARSGLKLSM